MKNKYRYISLQDRKEIAKRYGRGDRAADIAAYVGVSQAAVYRELQRGYTGGVDGNRRPAYDPMVAQEAVQRGFKRRGRKAEARA